MNAAAIDTEAAEWLVRLEDRTSPGDSLLQAEFYAWLGRSPRHVKSFLACADALRGLDGLDPERRIDVDRLLDERLAQVVPLPSQRVAVQGRTRSSRRARAWSAAAVVAISIGAGFATYRNAGDIETATGEQRTVQLNDGSLLHLNTRTRARVEFSSTAREIRLLEGEALFVVEQDTRRPFMVDVDGVTIQALGTQFNVYRHAGESTVSVIEGRVRAGSVELGAGEQALIRGATVEKRAAPLAADPTAWRERRLAFRNTPLADVAEEFNRYNKMQIRVEGSVGAKEITGIFSADHPQSLILYLKKDADLDVAMDDKAVTILGRQGSPRFP